MTINKGFYNTSQLIKLLKICSDNNYSMISIKSSSDEYFQLKASNPISKNIDDFLASLLDFPYRTYSPMPEYVFIKIIINDYPDSTNYVSKEKFKYMKELDQLSQCLFIDNGEPFHIIDKLMITEDFIGVRVTKYFYRYLLNSVPLKK